MNGSKKNPDFLTQDRILLNQMRLYNRPINRQDQFKRQPRIILFIILSYHLWYVPSVEYAFAFQPAYTGVSWQYRRRQKLNSYQRSKTVYQRDEITSENLNRLSWIEQSNAQRGVTKEANRQMSILFSSPSTTNPTQKTSNSSSITMQSKRARPDRFLDEKLVKSLDLFPLLSDGIGQYCGTKRGRDALLALASKDAKSNAFDRTKNTSGGRANQLKFMSFAINSSISNNINASSKISSESFNNQSHEENSEIQTLEELQSIDESSMKTTDDYDILDIHVRVARSAEEARNEYLLVQEASDILSVSTVNQENNRDSLSSITNSTRTTHITAPPIYGASSTSPFDLATSIMENGLLSDNDEWIHSWSGVLSLEDILKAEQTLKIIIMTHDWSLISDKSAPILSKFISQHLGNDGKDQTSLKTKITELYHRTMGSVVITTETKTRNASSPLDRLYDNRPVAKSYQFVLNGEKYSELQLLREEEKGIKKEMEESVRLFAKGHKRRKGPEPFEEGSTLSNELERVQKERMATEEKISQAISRSIREVSAEIDYGWNVIAKIDTVFARAAYGIRHNGIIPLVGSEGRIHVERFVNPILSLKQQQSRNSQNRPHQLNPTNIDNKKEPAGVVPIDLFLSAKRGEEAIIISGANGGGKSVALKSFGLVSILCQLGIPIPIQPSAASDSPVIHQKQTRPKIRSSSQPGNMPTMTNSDIGNHKNNNSDNDEPVLRVDYFSEILVDIGDDQSLMDGQSTLMAKLSTFATILQTIQGSTNTDAGTRDTHDNATYDEKQQQHVLILLDELGSGTDPNSGSAIAQSILEEILEINPNISDKAKSSPFATNKNNYNSRCRIVATTHSPQLKDLSLNDDRFGSATVLLEDQNDYDVEDNNRHHMRNYQKKRPSFRLAYGYIGDSHALGAASRCQPSLPESVLARAEDLLSGGAIDDNCDDEYGTAASSSVKRAKAAIQYYESLNTSLEQERDYVNQATCEAVVARQDAQKLLRATSSLARSYESQLSRLETRLDGIWQELASMDGGKSSSTEVIGKTLSTLRLVKKRVETQSERLARQGLKLVPKDYVFRDGDQVVIVLPGEYEGVPGTIVEDSQFDYGDNEKEGEEETRKADTNLERTNSGVADTVLVIPSFHVDGWISPSSKDDILNAEDSTTEGDTASLTGSPSFSGSSVDLFQPTSSSQQMQPRGQQQQLSLRLQRTDIAIWDYINAWEENSHASDNDNKKRSSGVNASQQRLQNLFQKIEQDKSPSSAATSKKQQQNTDPRKVGSNRSKSEIKQNAVNSRNEFTSSRERKAAKKKKKKKK